MLVSCAGRERSRILAAPVVLCEIDFEVLTKLERKKLFVGMSRAQLRLECIVSECAEQALAHLL